MLCGGTFASVKRSGPELDEGELKEIVDVPDVLSKCGSLKELYIWYLCSMGPRHDEIGLFLDQLCWSVARSLTILRWCGGAQQDDFLAQLLSFCSNTISGVTVTVGDQPC